MMKKIGKHLVDVARVECGPDLPCYVLGHDQGSYVQGRGYTSYHDKPLPVCWTRHLRGCPDAGECVGCGAVQSPAGMKAVSCWKCGSAVHG